MRSGIADLHLGSELIVVSDRVATREELARVHDRGYLDELGAYCYEGGGELDQDTYATHSSWASPARRRQRPCRHRRASTTRRRGGLRRDEAARTPRVARPRHGLLPLDNIAVAAATLRSQGERVLIFDWDVHHGNGTQQIFWDDPEVLYVSTHQWPLFPAVALRARLVVEARSIGPSISLCPLAPRATSSAGPSKISPYR